MERTSDPAEQRLQRDQEAWQRLMAEVRTCERAVDLLQDYEAAAAARQPLTDATIRDLEALAERLKREAGVLG